MHKKASGDIDANNYLLTAIFRRAWHLANYTIQWRLNQIITDAPHPCFDYIQLVPWYAMYGL
jgi:hypothetical protein